MDQFRRKSILLISMCKLSLIVETPWIDQAILCHSASELVSDGHSQDRRDSDSLWREKLSKGARSPQEKFILILGNRGTKTSCCYGFHGDVRDIMQDLRERRAPCVSMSELSKIVLTKREDMSSIDSKSQGVNLTAGYHPDPIIEFVDELWQCKFFAASMT